MEQTAALAQHLSLPPRQRTARTNTVSLECEDVPSHSAVQISSAGSSKKTRTQLTAQPNSQFVSPAPLPTTRTSTTAAVCHTTSSSLTPETTIHTDSQHHRHHHHHQQQHAPYGTKFHHASTAVAAVTTPAKAKATAEAGRQDTAPLVTDAATESLAVGAGVSMAIMVGEAVASRRAVGEAVGADVGANVDADVGVSVSNSRVPAVGEGVGEPVISNCCCRFRKPLVRNSSSSSASSRSMRSAPSRWFRGELSETAGPAIARTTTARVATRTRKDTIVVVCVSWVCCAGLA